MLVAFSPLASAATAYAECARPELSGLTPMRLIGLAVSFVLAPFVALAEQRAGKSYRNYILVVTVGFRRLVALGVIASMTLTGCASGYYYGVPDLRDRANQIASIAVVPVDVRVFRDGFGSRQISGDESETARTNLRNALAKHFGSNPRFAVKEFDPKAAEATQPELKQVLLAIEGMWPPSMEKGGACLAPFPRWQTLPAPTLCYWSTPRTTSRPLTSSRWSSPASW